MRFRFAIYPPETADMPWLAVAFERDRLADAFPCPSRKAAETGAGFDEGAVRDEGRARAPGGRHLNA
jgi:hypothetical protein